MYIYIYCSKHPCNPFILYQAVDLLRSFKMATAAITLSQVLKQKNDSKFSVNCKIVFGKGAEFTIADSTASLGLLVHDHKLNQAKYFEVERYIKIVNPTINKQDKCLIIDVKTFVFQGKPIKNLKIEEQKFKVTTTKMPEEYTKLSTTFELEAKKVYV
jgi:hypothetical protein